MMPAQRTGNNESLNLNPPSMPSLPVSHEATSQHDRLSHSSASLQSDVSMDFPGQLTSQDAKALEDIQAELEKIQRAVSPQDACDFQLTSKSSDCSNTDPISQSVVLNSVKSTPLFSQPSSLVLQLDKPPADQNAPVSTSFFNPTSSTHVGVSVLSPGVASRVLSNQTSGIVLSNSVTPGTVTSSSGQGTLITNATLQNVAALKRPLTTNSSQAPVITKVFIAKNSAGIRGLPQSVSVQHLKTSSGQTITMPSGSGAVRVISQQTGHVQQSPTKTIMLSSQGILTSATGGRQFVTAIPGSPNKFGGTKIAISPVKSPGKVNTLIPVTMAKSRQSRTIAPFRSSVVTVVTHNIVSTTPVSVTSAANSATYTTTSKMSLLPNMSPSKVFIRPSIQKTQGKDFETRLKENPGTLSDEMKISLGIGQMSNINRTLLSGHGTGIQQLTALSAAVSSGVLSSTGLTNTGISPGMQQITVPGSKFQYVRLVTPPQNLQQQLTSVAGMKSKPIITAGSGIVSTPGSSQLKITIPVTQNTTQNVAPKPSPQYLTQIASNQPNQRILLPAPNQTKIHPSGTDLTSVNSGAGATVNLGQLQSVAGVPVGGAVAGVPMVGQVMTSIANTCSPALSQLPPGTTLLSTGGGNIAGVGGMQGFALVPAQYVAQLHRQLKSATPQPMQNKLDFIPIASSDPEITANTLARNNVNGGTLEASGTRPRKPCNCTKSQCLKLYCDCFANGEFCHNCNCTNCANNLEHEEERSRAIKACLDRNPLAFHPKIGKGRDGERDRMHNKGCNCKRSGCLKNYCECYEAKIMCSNACKCVGCKNYEESSERKTLMHLADAADLRVHQQTAAKAKFSSQIPDLPSRQSAVISSGEKLPYTFVTSQVAEATCACLLAQAEEAERLRLGPVIQERMVIEEFGRCLMQIIESSSRTKAPSPV